MSASDKKRLHKEENQAKLTERQQAEQREAKKLKTNTIIFVVAIALVFVIGLGMLVYNWYTTSGIRDRSTTAVEIGGHKLSVTDLNYYYVDMMNELSQDWYSMYLLQIEEGFDSAVSLDDQLYHGEEGKTWGDYFIERAVQEASGILALADKATAEGYTLTEEEKTSIDDTIVAMETQGMLYGYTNVDDFLQAIYGNGATEKSYRNYVENLTLAQSFYNNYTENLEYTDEQILAQDKEAGSYSAFDYAYFYVDPDVFMSHEGEETGSEHAHTDEEKAAALEAAKATAEEIVKSGAATKEDLDKAIASLSVYNPNSVEGEKTEEEQPTETEENPEATGATGTTEATAATEATATTEATEATEATGTTETTGATEATGTTETTGATEGTETPESTEPTDETDSTEETVTVPTATLLEGNEYALISTAYNEWFIEEGRKIGDIGAVPYYPVDEEGNKAETAEGYYVVLFLGEDKHEENLVAVRHILKSYTGGTTDENTGETVYSDEEKKAASDKIKEIQAEWEASDKTEETFAELAKKYTDDSNGSEGGLYNELYRGWAVEEFDAWCFNEARKPGDVGIVDTEYGSHLIYFVEVRDVTYREYMITMDLRAADSEAWFTELRDNYSNNAKIGNTSAMNTDIIMAG